MFHVIAFRIRGMVLNVVVACEGCVFTLSFALIAAAEINASVPMILVGRIIGGLAVGKYTTI